MIPTEVKHPAPGKDHSPTFVLWFMAAIMTCFYGMSGYIQGMRGDPFWAPLLLPLPFLAIGAVGCWFHYRKPCNR